MLMFRNCVYWYGICKYFCIMKRLCITLMLLLIASGNLMAGPKAYRAVVHTVTNKDLSLTFYPNPASNFLNIKYTTDKYAQVELGIYDIIGRQVIEVVNCVSEASTETVSINISDKLNAGVYFVRLKCGANIITKRLIVR